MLSERKQQILRAVIRDYVLTAEPVASRTLSRKYDFGLSPATIRNELADLEEEGLLRQPHTSAGRIPSDTGYRVYVDNLLERQLLPPEKRRMVEAQASLAGDLPDLLGQTAKMTAVLAQCTAVVRAPRLVRGRIRFVQVLPVSDGSGDDLTREALLVILLDRGTPANHRIRLPAPISADELANLGNFLNHHLRGRTMGELTGQLLERLTGEVAAYHDLLAAVWARLAGGADPAERVYLSHASFLAQQPEFVQDPTRVATLLNLLEREPLVASLLDQLGQAAAPTNLPDAPAQARVSIGGENPFPDLQGCSVVTARYGGDDLFGEVAVIGPTRMDYATALDAVELMAEQLTRALHQLFGLD